MDARFCAFHTSLRHMGYANTLGLAKLGVTADFSVEGGVVVLGDDDMPEGLLKENAYFAVFQRSIHTAVNRTTTAGRILGPDQRISPLDALKAYTVNAAKCSARDHVVGTIAPGYYADFVLLSANPLTIPPESIETLSVLKTISGGRIVYES